MSDVAIRCENLSKQYRLGERESYKALRDTLSKAFLSPFKRTRSILEKNSGNNILWALRNISFEVRHGEVIGIIGQNGAGKSTLLKILSRITKPTEGHVDVYGRVGSLLEVGTGFHPELSGRENVFLNGAILGMGKAEIKRKFDEIISFAEIERFVDTPVKRYSSGMYVRLAFAVAVHLEPEILVVDEVLAVGDAQFQKKCFEKMRSIGKGGRTILFVSHNMSAVRNICQRGLVLDRGKLIEAGAIDYVVDKYLARNHEDSFRGEQIETPSFVVNKVDIYSMKSGVIKTFDPVEIKVKFTPKKDILDPGLYVAILSLENQRITALDFKDFANVDPIVAGTTVSLGFSLNSLPLLPGEYQLEIYLKDMSSHKIELVPKTFPFEIIETPVYGGRKIDSWYGYIALNARAFSHYDVVEEIMN